MQHSINRKYSIMYEHVHVYNNYVHVYNMNMCMCIYAYIILFIVFASKRLGMSLHTLPKPFSFQQIVFNTFTIRLPFILCDYMKAMSLRHVMQLRRLLTNCANTDNHKIFMQKSKILNTIYIYIIVK